MDRVEEYLSTHDPRSDEDLFTTTINLKEVAVGVHLHREDPSFMDVVADLGWLNVVPFEARDAHHAGAIEAERQADESIDANRLNALASDVLIAAVARRRDATVVTENVRDFRVFDVPVERY